MELKIKRMKTKYVSKFSFQVFHFGESVSEVQYFGLLTYSNAQLHAAMVSYNALHKVGLDIQK